MIVFMCVFRFALKDSVEPKRNGPPLVPGTGR
jgi:hypothetical protein